MTERTPGRDRFLPFSLCKVVPFEASAAALHALPTVQPRAPTAGSLLPECLPFEGHHPNDDVNGLVLDMLADTAREW
jgi:hypothetical protein